jgi:hypothetical protein
MVDDLGVLIERMEDLLVPLRERRDHRGFFHATYLRTTRAVAAELAGDGFADTDWVTRLDVAFARFYLDALDADGHGYPVPAPWARAFSARPDIAPPRHVLLGMNAHINYDLPQALLAVISDAEFSEPALLARREADHRHVDRVLAVVADSASTGLRGLVFKRLLRTARGNAWANARALATARRLGATAYQAGVDELGRLVTARAADIVRPGPVLPRLIACGFGVTLRPAHTP